LLNVKQTKIRGDFIFGGCKFNNSKTIKPVGFYGGSIDALELLPAGGEKKMHFEPRITRMRG
jgi:hypothetical protein